jgi:hypothetical protein
MSAFYEHHKASILFRYSCFDRILLNAAMPLLIRPDRAHGFFTHHRNIYPVTRRCCMRSPSGITSGCRTRRRGGQARS